MERRPIADFVFAEMGFPEPGERRLMRIVVVGERARPAP